MDILLEAGWTATTYGGAPSAERTQRRAMMRAVELSRSWGVQFHEKGREVGVYSVAKDEDPDALPRALAGVTPPSGKAERHSVLRLLLVAGLDVARDTGDDFIPVTLDSLP